MTAEGCGRWWVVAATCGKDIVALSASARWLARGWHGGFGCTIRSVPLRWLAIGFRVFDNFFYNRNSIRSYRDPMEIARTFAPRGSLQGSLEVRAF